LIGLVLLIAVFEHSNCSLEILRINLIFTLASLIEMAITFKIYLIYASSKVLDHENNYSSKKYKNVNKNYFQLSWSDDSLAFKIFAKIQE